MWLDAQFPASVALRHQWAGAEAAKDFDRVRLYTGMSPFSEAELNV